MEGQVFDDYTVIRFVERKNNNNYYLVRCNVCGHEKVIGESNIKKQDNHHSKFNCKDDYYKVYIGNQFGDYICTYISRDYVKGFRMVMKCTICGHILSINESNLRTNSLKHCASRCKEDYYNHVIGQVYGDLKIISIAGIRGSSVAYNCECIVCGTQSVRTMQALKKDIRHGKECFKQIPDSEIKSVIAQRWYNMYERCNNPNNDHYYLYGGRGIKLCYTNAIDLYLDFKDELIEHANIHGVRNSTFDRIDVNGDYVKDNIRIATQSIQSTNTRKKKLFIIENGSERIIADNAIFCGDYLGLNGHSIGNVVRGSSKSCGGWTLYRILDPSEDVNDVINNEGVTTNLIIS